MKTVKKGGGYELELFNEQRAIAQRVLDAKPSVTTTHKIAYKQIREDFQRQMGSLQRKRKSEIASENMRLYKKIQSIQTKPSSVKKNMGYFDSFSRIEEQQQRTSGLARKHHNMTSTNSVSRSPNQSLEVLPIRVRDEQQRIQRQNAKLDAKLNSVRSNIPMNSQVRERQGELMDNYRRFASKYNGQGPKLDPLISKRLKDLGDPSPGRNMLSHSNVSQVSLNNISVKYNEGSALAKQSNLLKKGHFMRKSQSLHSRNNNTQSKRSLHQIISQKQSPQKMPNLLRNNSNDLMDVLNNDVSQEQLLMNTEPDLLDQSNNEIQRIAQNRSMFSSDVSAAVEPSPYENSNVDDDIQQNVINSDSKKQLLGLVDSQRGRSMMSFSSVQVTTQESPEYSTLMALKGRNQQSIKTLGGLASQIKKPTISRAVDSSIQMALRGPGREERMEQKRAAIRNKDMDLTDLISRLEGRTLF